MKEIGKIRTDFKDKFAIPRQSGLVKELKGKIVFNKEFSDKSFVRGLDSFSHIWVIWGFNKNFGLSYSATVRPPKLGGNKKVGVFASRSPFRPNPIGLSCLEIEQITTQDTGTVIYVNGIDMADNSPVYDIKPYLPSRDIVYDATENLIKEKNDISSVMISGQVGEDIPAQDIYVIKKLLYQNPIPSYQKDSNRIYSFEYKNINVKFKVEKDVIKITHIGYI